MKKHEQTNGNASSGEESDEYSVGYRKPPRTSQFQKGHSGNPKGRPKRRTNLGVLLAEGLKTEVRVTSGSTVKKLSKAQVMLISLVSRALQGDQKAYRSVIRIANKTGLLKVPIDPRSYGVRIVPIIETSQR